MWNWGRSGFTCSITAKLLWKHSSAAFSTGTFQMKWRFPELLSGEYVSTMIREDNPLLSRHCIYSYLDLGWTGVKPFKYTCSKFPSYQQYPSKHWTFPVTCLYMDAHTLVIMHQRAVSLALVVHEWISLSCFVRKHNRSSWPGFEQVFWYGGKGIWTMLDSKRKLGDLKQWRQRF